MQEQQAYIENLEDENDLRTAKLAEQDAVIKELLKRMEALEANK